MLPGWQEESHLISILSAKPRRELALSGLNIFTQVREAIAHFFDITLLWYPGPTFFGLTKHNRAPLIFHTKLPLHLNMRLHTYNISGLASWLKCYNSLWLRSRFLLLGQCQLGETRRVLLNIVWNEWVRQRLKRTWHQWASVCTHGTADLMSQPNILQVISHFFLLPHHISLSERQGADS